LLYYNLNFISSKKSDYKKILKSVFKYADSSKLVINKDSNFYFTFKSLAEWICLSPTLKSISHSLLKKISLLLLSTWFSFWIVLIHSHIKLFYCNSCSSIGSTISLLFFNSFSSLKSSSSWMLISSESLTLQSSSIIF